MSANESYNIIMLEETTWNELNKTIDELIDIFMPLYRKYCPDMDGTIRKLLNDLTEIQNMDFVNCQGILDNSTCKSFLQVHEKKG
jgi:phosphatidylglycerophosphatase A